MKELFRTAKGIVHPKTEGMRVYADLAYGRFEDFVKTSFPNFCRCAGESIKPIVREFLREKHSEPLLLKLGRDFFDFFKAGDLPLKERYPFLEELLLYELLEIELFNAPDDLYGGEFSWEGAYRLSETALLRSFSYPVHKCEGMTPEKLAKGRGSFYLLLYRGKGEDVRSVELTEFVFSFLKDIAGGASPEEALKARGLGEEEKGARPYLEKFLKELLDLGVLVKN